MAVPLIAGAGALLGKAITVTAVAGFLAKFLAAIGLAVFSVVGVDAAFDLIHNTLTSYLGGVAADVVAFIDISGITTVISWTMGAYAARISIQAAKASLGVLSKLKGQ
jgi:uncharacterized membrane protein YeiH